MASVLDNLSFGFVSETLQDALLLHMMILLLQYLFNIIHFLVLVFNFLDILSFPTTYKDFWRMFVLETSFLKLQAISFPSFVIHDELVMLLLLLFEA